MLFLPLEHVLCKGSWGDDMCSLAGGTHGRGETGVSGISALQSINESSWGLWRPGLRNGLIKYKNGFLLLVCFDFMMNLLVVVKDDEENTKCYYFL